MNISLKFKKALKKIIQEIDPNIHHAELPSSIVIPMRYIPDYLEKNEELLANAFNRLKDKKSQKTFLCVVAATAHFDNVPNNAVDSALDRVCFYSASRTNK